MTQKICAIYSGDVQGVGFRYTARDIASGFGLKGYVKNLSSGSVEIVAEGEEDELGKFIRKIEDYFKKNITKKEIRRGEGQGGFENFKILF